MSNIAATEATFTTAIMPTTTPASGNARFLRRSARRVLFLKILAIGITQSAARLSGPPLRALLFQRFSLLFPKQQNRFHRTSAILPLNPCCILVAGQRTIGCGGQRRHSSVINQGALWSLGHCCNPWKNGVTASKVRPFIQVFGAVRVCFGPNHSPSLQLERIVSLRQRKQRRRVIACGSPLKNKSRAGDVADADQLTRTFESSYKFSGCQNFLVLTGWQLWRLFRRM